MRSVVLISGGPDHSARYRCAHAAEQLGCWSVPAAVFHPGQTGALRKALETAAIVILHRIPHAPWVDEICRATRARGGLMLFDLDDNVIEPAAALHPAQVRRLNGFQRLMYREEVRLFRRCVNRCEGLLTSTEALLRTASRAGREARLHRNGFSLRMLSRSSDVPRKKPGDPPTVLGYASGTPTHDLDLRWAKPALLEVLARHPGAELWLVGPVRSGEWGAVGPRVRRFPAVPWTELPAVLSRFDVNLAPLAPSNPFNNAKSEVKYIEAALVGVPTVASRDSAFADAIRHGRNGLLAGPAEDWQEQIESLLDDSVRLAMGAEARRDVLSRYHPSVRGAELLGTLNGLAVRLGGKPFWPDPSPAPRAPVEGDLGATLPEAALLDKVRHALRTRGGLSLLLQTASALRERVRP